MEQLFQQSTVTIPLRAAIAPIVRQHMLDLVEDLRIDNGRIVLHSRQLDLIESTEAGELDGAGNVLTAAQGGDDIITHTFESGAEVIFLRGAVEIWDDGVGNDDGLCESDETCLYSPNIGAYQGHGELISAGNIGSGAAIENVTLVKYSTNGL